MRPAMTSPLLSHLRAASHLSASLAAWTRRFAAQPDVDAFRETLAWPPPASVVEGEPLLKQALAPQKDGVARARKRAPGPSGSPAEGPLSPSGEAQPGQLDSSATPGTLGEGLSAGRRVDYARVFEPSEVVRFLEEARLEDVRCLDVRGRCAFTEWLVLGTGRSHQQLRLAAGGVVHRLQQRVKAVAPGLAPSIEGDPGSDWLAVDCGGIVVHIFLDEARAYYDLEALWDSSRQAAAPGEGGEGLDSETGSISNSREARRGGWRTERGGRGGKAVRDIWALD